MKRRTTIMITIISGVFTMVSGILEKIASNTPLPPFLTPYLPFAWPAFLAVSALTAGIAVWQTFRQEETGHPESTREKQNRQRMLEPIRTKQPSMNNNINLIQTLPPSYATRSNLYRTLIKHYLLQH